MNEHDLKAATDQGASEEKSPREIFSRIYSEKLWGADGLEFSSGGGSADPRIVEPYVARIIEELSLYGENKPGIVDLGCGNFNVGRRFAGHCSRYAAVDVVPGLIESLKRGDHPSHIEFLNLDIVEDELPEGDVCFLKQVLQHLSNRQIMKILPKLKKYKVIYITEQQPMSDEGLIPNKDTEAGPGTRMHENSGVYLDRSPFNFQALSSQLILEVPGGPDAWPCDGVIRTYKFKITDP